MRKLLISLLLLVGLFSAAPADAAIAFVNHASASAVSTAGAPTSSTHTSAMNVTTGNFLVCAFLVTDTASLTGLTIADTATNTFHLVTGGPYHPAAWKMYIYYAYNVTGNATDTITVSSSASFIGQAAVDCTQFSGVGTTDPSTGTLANAVGGPPNGSIASGSLSLPGTSGISYAAIIVNPTLTAGSGYTSQSVDGTGNMPYFFDEYQIVSSSISATASSTDTMFGWDISAAMFSTGSAPPAAGGLLFQNIP